jgi:hypothetical protein
VLRLDEKTLYWWIDHVATIASVPLALIGFGVAIWQIVKTRRAADAATAAATSVLEQVQRLSLVRLLPQLTRIDDEIDRAVQVQSVEVLRVWISQWRWQAGEVRGYLDPTVRENEKVMKLIQSSIVAASDARRNLHTVTPDELAAATADLRKLVGRVTGELGVLAARQTSGIEGSHDA